jgi:hypothetical protein
MNTKNNNNFKILRKNQPYKNIRSIKKIKKIVKIKLTSNKLKMYQLE